MSKNYEIEVRNLIKRIEDLKLENLSKDSIKSLISYLELISNKTLKELINESLGEEDQVKQHLIIAYFNTISNDIISKKYTKKIQTIGYSIYEYKDKTDIYLKDEITLNTALNECDLNNFSKAELFLKNQKNKIVIEKIEDNFKEILNKYENISKIRLFKINND